MVHYRNLIILTAVAFIFIFSVASVQAVPVTVIEQGDTWEYAVLPVDLWPIWDSVNYSSFDWENAMWLTGQAPFGTPCEGSVFMGQPCLPHNTFWLEDTDLALTKAVMINGVFAGPLTLHAASDNGFIVFVNGTMVFKDNQSWYTEYWEYTIPIDPSVFSPGLNTISVLAEDHTLGMVAFFDMELIGELQCVPPTASVLFEDFEDSSGFTVGGGYAHYWGVAPLSGTLSIPSYLMQGGSQCGNIFYGSFAEEYEGSPPATMTINLPDFTGYTNLQLSVALAAADGTRLENTHRNSLIITGTTGTGTTVPIDSFLPLLGGSPLTSQVHSIDLHYEFQDFIYNIDSSLTSLTFAFASTAYNEVTGIDSVRITGDPPAVLTVTKQGNGTGTVTSDPPGIDCGSDCTESYNHGTVVTLTANPDPGSVFSGWLDGSCPVPGDYQLTLTKDTTITALFINTGNFTKVTMVFPNGGESLHPDQECTAIWGGPPTAESYKLFYSLNNGITWKRITTQPVTGTSMLWTVPKAKKNRATCRTKVVGYNGTKKIGADKSDKPFTIEVLKLDYPNGGDPPFYSGQNITITWTTHPTKRPVNTVKLSYTLDNGITWKPFLSQPPPGSNPGSHTVQLPRVKKTKSKCKVKVVLKDSNGIKVGSDVSNGVFTILNP